jgi:two-component system cell cycle sensor histidine kinase/response regulator CckA
VKRTVAVSTNTLALSGNKVHVLAVIYDLTRQKQAENERLELERRAQHVQKIESLGAMAGGIAHDFNNILMVILGNIELVLAEAPKSSSLRSRLEEIEKSVFMAADLTRKILAYTGKTQFVITAVDISKLAKETSGSLAELLPAAIEIQTRLAPKLPAVKGDAAKICQVIANLVTNAAEAYAPDKGGRITVSTGTLYCDADYLAHTVKDVTGYENPPPEGVYVFLEVADSAGGMDEKAARRVFDPFFTTKFQGRGLGMSTVLGIVRGLSGAIRLESAVGKGTTVRVLFPAASEDTPVCGQDAATFSAGGKHGDRMILLVDDESNIRTLARTMLERLGYRVLSAGNGQEAIRIYREKYRDIHCVLLDLSMPEMSGKEVFQKLRRLDPNVCVILSSGYTEEDVMAQFKGEGPAGFIQKPYRLQTLRKKMKKILDDVASGRCSISDP